MGGVRQPDHGGVQAENNGGREFILGKTAIENGVRGVLGGTCGWIPVKSHDDSTREGRTTAAPLAPQTTGGPRIYKVDAVVRHWLEGLQTAKEEKGAKGGGAFLGGIIRI